MGRQTWRSTLSVLTLTSMLSCREALKLIDSTYFGVLGDWGGQSEPPFTTPAQLSAAAALSKVAQENAMKFMISAGGNFLESGLPGAEANRPTRARSSSSSTKRTLETAAGNPETLDRVAATFDNVYTADSVQIPWYVTGGYQDWAGNLTAEMGLNGSDATSGRWNFPDLWHTFSVTLPPNGETVQIIMVDTETLTGGQNYRPPNLPVDLYYPPAPGESRRRRLRGAPAPLSGGSARALARADPAAAGGGWEEGSGGGGGGEDGPAGGARRGLAGRGGRRRGGRAQRRLLDFEPPGSGPPISNEQWDWVGKTLNASTADWLIVVGNNPVWSAGDYGPNWLLAERLVPMMEEAGVALYISGREPIMQHFRSIPAGSVDYVGTGNGAYFNESQAAMLPNLASCPYESLAFKYGSSSGFVGVEVTSATSKLPGQLTVTFFDDAGNSLYSFSKGPTRSEAEGKGAAAGAGKGAGGVLGIVAGLFIVVAVGLCVIAAGGGSKKGQAWTPADQAYAEAYLQANAPKPRRRGGGEATELTPLSRGAPRGGATEPPAG